MEKSELRFEQEKQIPRLLIDKTAPVLDEKSMRTLEEQWEKFWRLRFTEQEREISAEQGTRLLKNDALLHHLAYDENTLPKILQSGILLGELGYNEKETQPEDAETHYCADFFVNQNNKSVAEYIDYAQGMEESLGKIKKKRMESYMCPKENNDRIAIVIDQQKSELVDLLSHSATGIDADSLLDFGVRFPNGDKPEITKRHLAVLVGIPANFISSIIIGGKLADDQERISKLKELVVNSGLDIQLLDYKGEKI